MSDVLLVCMPFGPAFSPSIGLSLLKAQLGRAGVTSRIRYFSLDFAERIGQHFYCGIASEGRPSVRELAGEWIFARALQLGGPARDRHGQRYVDEILRQGAPDAARTWDRPASPALIARLLRARDGA